MDQEHDIAATLVVCTRNRGDKIVATIQSLMAGTVQCYELLIIDQSDGDETLNALAPFLDDERVRYLRSSEIGVARSRSLALREARHEFVLNTDDDCIVAPDWVESCLQALIDHPKSAIVFGDVIGVPDAEAGYAPESIAKTDFVVRSLWSWRATDGINVGIGASMAMRRSALLDLGAFDHRLGPGTEFRNAEDTDISLRAVLGGYELVRTRRASVDHYGHRTHEEFRSLTQATMLAVGAVCGKLVRRHPLPIAWYLSTVVWQLIVKVALADLVRLRKPPVLRRATYLARGFAVGVRIPLENSEHALFRAVE